MKISRIVVVEADATKRLRYEHILQELQCSVRGLEQITQATPKLQPANCDLLIVGLRPDSMLDQEHLLAWICANPDIPVITILSLPSAEDVREVFRAGVEDVLFQPVAPEELLSSVRSAGRHRKFKAQELTDDQLQTASRMASGIAHNFNNLLEPLMGRTSLLLDREDLPADMKQELQAILDDTRDLSAFVRRISHFGQSGITRRTVIRPLSILQEVIRRLADRRDARVRLTGSTDTEVTILGEERLLAELLHEILINAHEAGPPGQWITISVNVVAEVNRRQLVIDVEDEGPGLTPCQVEHLFQPFFSTKEPPGRGLGLTVAAGIAQRLGGSLQVRNRAPHGVRATIRFPVANAKPAAPKPSQNPIVAEKGSIMVVDDEEAVLKMVSRMVSKASGSPTISVTNGPEALAILARSEPNISLILLDLCLRGESGLDVYRKVRQSNPHLPVLFISGLASDPDLEQTLKQDPNTRFLPKPFELAQLRLEMSRLRSTS